MRNHIGQAFPVSAQCMGADGSSRGTIVPELRDVPNAREA